MCMWRSSRQGPANILAKNNGRKKFANSLNCCHCSMLKRFKHRGSRIKSRGLSFECQLNFERYCICWTLDRVQGFLTVKVWLHDALWNKLHLLTKFHHCLLLLLLLLCFQVMPRYQSSYGIEDKMHINLRNTESLLQWKEGSAVMAVALTNSNHMTVGTTNIIAQLKDGHP